MPRLAITGQKIADKHYLEYGPGNLMFNTVNRRNKTHLEVTTTMQMFGFLSTLDTRFLIQLRNPTDRYVQKVFGNLSRCKHLTHLTGLAGLAGYALCSGQANYL